MLICYGAVWFTWIHFRVQKTIDFQGPPLVFLYPLLYLNSYTVCKVICKTMKQMLDLGSSLRSAYIDVDIINK
jgi:hypothetical protein